MFGREKYRPEFHFTPERNWMNDPNGLVFYKGKYHLFYQHNPLGDTWGNMSWGHAVSEDLFNWSHKPIALLHLPDAGIYSGSVVVDHTNSSGFGSIENPPLIAIFTRAMNDKSNQSQCLAFSIDEGETWSYFEANPVLDISYTDFRDPKVWWDDENNRWLLVAVKSEEFKAIFFQSENLKDWTQLSEFGPAAAIGGCWECPDLFPLTTLQGRKKWVLLISINPGGPNGGSATQYFIGEWDGKKFVADDLETRWLDHGFDNYAGVTFNEAPEGRRIFLGWMSNWIYAAEVPTSPWRSAMTVPRELGIIEQDGKFQLTQVPVKEFSFPYYEVEMSSTETSTLDIVNGDKKVVISYFPERRRLRIDRSLAWMTDSPHTQHEFTLNSPRFTLILDRSGIELFGDDGAIVATDLTLLDGGDLLPSEQITLTKLQKTAKNR